MKEKNRVITFLIRQYGNKNADKAIVSFTTKKAQYIKQVK